MARYNSDGSGRLTRSDLGRMLIDCYKGINI
jgi:hypothetical protein